jgi:hypothetical protein
MKTSFRWAFVSAVLMLFSAISFAEETQQPKPAPPPGQSKPQQPRPPQTPAQPLPQPPERATCSKTCLLNADCGIGGSCEGGLCRSLASFCSDELWSTNDRGESKSCRGYTCDPSSGLCRQKAAGQLECTAGYIFDASNQSCVPSVVCQDPGSTACRELWAKWQMQRGEYEARHPRPTPNNFLCQACTAHSDCPSDQMCWKGQCKTDKSYCSDDGLSVIHGRSDVVRSCGNTVCDVILGDCVQP